MLLKTNLLGTCQFTKQLLLLLRSAEKRPLLMLLLLQGLFQVLGKVTIAPLRLEL